MFHSYPSGPTAKANGESPPIRTVQQFLLNRRLITFSFDCVCICTSDIIWYKGISNLMLS